MPERSTEPDHQTTRPPQLSTWSPPRHVGFPEPAAAHSRRGPSQSRPSHSVNRSMEIRTPTKTKVVHIPGRVHFASCSRWEQTTHSTGWFPAESPQGSLGIKGTLTCWARVKVRPLVTFLMLTTHVGWTGNVLGEWCGQCVDSVWSVCGQCLDSVWTVSGQCLQSSSSSVNPAGCAVPCASINRSEQVS